MLIGRKEEKKILEEALKSESSEFIAVYGRRRIGKTFLVRETFAGRFTFQHAGLAGGNLNEQLFAFAASLKDAGLKNFNAPKNWLEGFELLKDIIRESKENKKVIFIDELSWMDTPRSDLIMALENFWNGWASARKDVVLIVCASATSWMIDKVIHSKGGLYNRLTNQINLKPFTLGECEEYVFSRGIAINRHQIIQAYMIMGGVPFYWTFLQKGLSLPQNIDKIFFAKEAPLRQEFDYLYASLFRNPREHIAIVSALGQKKTEMTREELVKATGMIASGNLTKKLDELEACGFIQRSPKYGAKRKGATYRLVDFFTLFYYKFMESHDPDDEHFWENRANSQVVQAWSGLAFERVCMQHVNQIKRKLGISGVTTEVRSWHCKADKDAGIFGSQIDMLIVRKDQIINLCEMKYSRAEYTLTAEDNRKIRQKVSDFVRLSKTEYAIHPTMITMYGIVENSYADEVQAEIAGDDLFA